MIIHIMPSKLQQNKLSAPTADTASVIVHEIQTSCWLSFKNKLFSTKRSSRQVKKVLNKLGWVGLMGERTTLTHFAITAICTNRSDVFALCVQEGINFSKLDGSLLLAKAINMKSNSSVDNVVMVTTLLNAGVDASKPYGYKTLFQVVVESDHRGDSVIQLFDILENAGAGWTWTDFKNLKRFRLGNYPTVLHAAVGNNQDLKCIKYILNKSSNLINIATPSGNNVLTLAFNFHNQQDICGELLAAGARLPSLLHSFRNAINQRCGAISLLRTFAPCVCLCRLACMELLAMAGVYPL